jgi:hypothetical protein
VPVASRAIALKDRMLIAVLAGALGAYVHLATSFADYAGNERLMASWGWWYLLRPFIGMALAEVVYLSLRGGLLSATGNLGDHAKPANEDHLKTGQRS